MSASDDQSLYPYYYHPILSGNSDIDLLILSHLSPAATTTLEQVEPNLSTNGLGQRLWHARLYQGMTGKQADSVGSKWDYREMPFRHGADYRRIYQVFHSEALLDYDSPASEQTRIGLVAKALLEALRDEILDKDTGKVRPISPTSERRTPVDIMYWDHEVSEVLVAYVDAVAGSYDDWISMMRELMKVAATVAAPYLAAEIVDRILVPPQCLHPGEIADWYGEAYVYSPSLGRWTDSDPEMERPGWPDSFYPEWDGMRLFQLDWILDACGRGLYVWTAEYIALCVPYYRYMLVRYRSLIMVAMRIVHEANHANFELTDILIRVWADYNRGEIIYALVACGPKLLQEFMAYPKFTNHPQLYIIIPRLHDMVSDINRYISPRDLVDCMDLMSAKWGIHITYTVRPNGMTTNEWYRLESRGFKRMSDILVTAYIDTVTTINDALYFLHGVERLWDQGVAAWADPAAYEDPQTATDIALWIEANPAAVAVPYWITLSKAVLLRQPKPPGSSGTMTTDELSAVIASALLTRSEDHVVDLVGRLPLGDDYYSSIHLHAMLLVHVARRLVSKVNRLHLSINSISHIDPYAGALLTRMYRLDSASIKTVNGYELAKALCQWFDVKGGPYQDIVILAAKIAVACQIIGVQVTLADTHESIMASRAIADATNRGDIARLAVYRELAPFVNGRVANVLPALLEPEALEAYLGILEVYYSPSVAEHVERAAVATWDGELRSVMERWLDRMEIRSRRQ